MILYCDHYPHLSALYKYISVLRRISDEFFTRILHTNSSRLLHPPYSSRAVYVLKCHSCKLLKQNQIHTYVMLIVNATRCLVQKKKNNNSTRFNKFSSRTVSEIGVRNLQSETFQSREFNFIRHTFRCYVNFYFHMRNLLLLYNVPRLSHQMLRSGRYNKRPWSNIFLFRSFVLELSSRA
jgi:hypothetical protein